MHPSRRSTWLFVACLVIVGVLSLVGPGPTAAFDIFTKPVVTSVFLPLSGMVMVGTDDVTLTGEVHVVSRVTTDSTGAMIAALYVNLSRTMGEGTTGLSYVGVGAVQMDQVSLARPPNPNVIGPLDFMLIVNGPAVGPGPTQSPLVVFLTLNFNGDGTLMFDGSSAAACFIDADGNIECPNGGGCPGC